MIASGSTPPSSSDARQRKRVELALLLAALTVAGILWFSRLGGRDLFHPDEGRYAEIPREMVESGDWITPRLNGLKYFEKPPLQYWATAVAYELFGARNATARLWPACIGFLGVLWIAFVGRRLFGSKAGAFAGLFLASSLLWVAMGHVLTLDMGLSGFLAVTVGAVALAQSSRSRPASCRGWMLVAWIALAAATLSKGPVAIVLIGATLAVYAFWQRDLETFRHLHLGKGLALYLLLAAPWFAVVGARNPGFLWFFFVHEHLARFATDVHGRVQPWWMFVPVIVVGSAPWIASAVGAIVHPGFSWRRGPGGFDPVRFLWVGCAITVVFFSASQSKLIPYVLPAFPALSLLAGRRLATTGSLRGDAIAAGALGLAILVASLAPGLFAPSDLSVDLLNEYRSHVLAASFCLVAAGAACAWRWRSGLRGAVLLASSALLAFQVLLLGLQCFSTVGSSRGLADAILESTPSGAPIYCVRLYSQPLPFYLRKTVDLVRWRGELEFGLLEDPRREIPDLDTFRGVWRKQDQAVAILGHDDYRSLERLGLPMRPIYEDSRRVAVMRR